MPTVAAVAAAYKRALGQFETVTLTRPGGASATVAARVLGIGEAPLVGGITQDNQVAIILAQDLTAVSFPVPPKKGDQLVIQGRTRTVEFADDATKRLAGTVIAYRLRLRG